MKLSIAIPVYNFAEFLPQTLQSIVSQEGADEVEILVVDGASTDNTPEVMATFCAAHPNVHYRRLPAKGGIDRDMAKSVELCSGEYCWLFSGDDIMSLGALKNVLEEIRTGEDLYLCKHAECFKDMTVLIPAYPILNPDERRVFELSDKAQRLEYFKRAVNSEAFFSFMGGLIVKRTTWDRVALNPDFIGSCWAHSARFFELMQSRLSVNYTSRVYLQRRGENDSFSTQGLVRRYQIQVEGFHNLVNRFFGAESQEAREVRRAIRNEFHRRVLMNLKVRCDWIPHIENKQLLDHLVHLAYRDAHSIEDVTTKLLYKWLPIRMAKRYYC